MTKLIATGLLALVAGNAAIAAGTDLLPGSWESSVTTMSGGKAETSTTRSCIEPGANLLKALLSEQQGDGCRYSRMVATGGRIDIAAACPTGSSVVSGAYTPTTLAFTMKGSLRIGASTLPLDMTVKSRRVATACSGDE